jgi:hypothetical protein
MKPPAYNRIPIDVSAGLTDFELICDGRQFEYISGNVLLYVKIDSRSATAIPLNPKEGFKFPYRSLFISCAASDQTVNLMMLKVDGFEFTRPEVNIGQDKSGYYDALVNANVYGAWLSQTPVTGKYSALQLWNPVSSGKLLVIDSLTVDGEPSYYAGGIETVALADASTRLAKPFNNAGPASVALLKSESITTGTFNATNSFIYNSTSHSIYKDVLLAGKNAIIVDEGEGFTLSFGSVNAWVWFNVFFRELPILT